MNSASSALKQSVLGLMFSVLCLPASAQIEVISGGKVGIGTSSPVGRLTVAGDGAVAADYALSQLFVTAGSSTNKRLALAYDTTNGLGLIQAYENGGTVKPLILQSVGGNVGIGTTSPNASVDVWKSYAAGTDSLRFSFNDGSAYWMGIQPYVVGAANVGYKFRTNNVNNTVDALAITGAGNIGIGTTSPVAKLDVAGGVCIGSSAGGSSLSIRSYSDGRNWWIRDDAGVDRLRFSRGSTDHVFWDVLKTPGNDAVSGQIWYANGAERIRLDSSGNVGIGTAIPGYKLQVAGNVRATSFISDTTTYADFVFAPGYVLSPLSEVEAHIKARGHLPGIPNEAEAREHGIDLGAMQVKLLQKVEELTLHVIAQEKRIHALEGENVRLKTIPDL